MTPTGGSKINDGWALYLQALTVPRDELIVDGHVSGAPCSYLRAASVDWTIGHRRIERVLRRGVDIAASGLALAAMAPFLLVVAAAVGLSSPGRALFRQERVGFHGRVFVCLKFRTMVHDAERRLPEMLAASTDFRDGLETDMKPAADTRITALGRILRRSSIDELPQLVNVLKGDMTIVGPRPFLPIEAVRFDVALPKILAVKPGLTGLWQVSGRNDLGFAGRVQMDLDYIETRSVATDLRIVARTPRALWRGTGAR